MKKEKKVSDSSVEMRELVMPHHANPLGTIFGGVVMSWIDMAASLCASRHAQLPVVTAQIDNIIFRHPVSIGNHVCIHAYITYVGKTSMEVSVQVESENPLTAEKKVTTTAHVTMVAVNAKGKPSLVPRLKLNSLAEKKLWEEAKKRVLLRKMK